MRGIRSRTALKPFLVFSGAVLLCGCSQLGSFDARKEATDRWKLTRAQVKAKLASDQLDAGHVRDAAGELAEALRLDPDNPRLVTLQARIALAQGDTQSAHRLLTALLSRGDSGFEAASQAEVHYFLGVVEQQRLRWEPALECFVRATELNRGEPAYLLAVSQALLQLGRPRDALDQLTAREGDFGYTGSYHAAIAECHEQLGDWSAAAAAWRHLGPTERDPAMQERLATALYRSGQYAEAAGILETLVGGYPIAHDGERAPGSLRLMLAECLLEDGQPEAARTCAALLAHDEPRNVACLLLLARIHIESARYAEALDAAERVLRVEGRNAAGLELAAALAYRVGNRNRAGVLAERLRRIEGEDDNPIAREILIATQAAQGKKSATARAVE